MILLVYQNLFSRVDIDLKKMVRSCGAQFPENVYKISFVIRNSILVFTQLNLPFWIIEKK